MYTITGISTKNVIVIMQWNLMEGKNNLEQFIYLFFLN